jgi:alpha-mannosidase
MKFEELIILLPCHSLEDFPLHHEGEEAEGLLANWTALWHPAFIAAAGKTPTWHRVDDPPEVLSNRLIVVPSVSVSELPTGFAQRAKAEDACLIRKKNKREEIIAQALEQLDGGDGGVASQWVADFLALGYCYLQVELLTRQMRYSSNLDEVHFNTQAVAAATALLEGNEEAAREKLVSCFDVLAEERDHYYPVDAFLIDLTLVAESTIGDALREELASSVPINLLMSSDVLKAMAESEPSTIASIREGIAEKKVGLVGGGAGELRLPLLGCETLLNELRGGLAICEAQLDTKPAVYGRRRFGLTPFLPQVLHKLGFAGALHATLDDGRFPVGMQIKTKWEGLDGTSLDALARAPLDATKPESYLNLAVKMGESMDMDHVATVCFAHWPGKTSPWYEDLRRIASFSSALGKFVTLEEYFRDTDDTGQLDRFTADQYRSPYLKQAIIRKHENPISTSVNYWRRRAAAESAQSLSFLAGQVSGDAGGGPHTEILEDVDRRADESEVGDLDSRVSACLEDSINQFSDSLPQKDSAAETGYLVINPCSFVRRLGIEVPTLADLPTVERPIYAVGESESSKFAVVDAPPMGFAWVSVGRKASRKRRKPPKPLVEDRSKKEGILVLHNEFFEAVIDPTIGTLRALYEYSSRGNRISQQLAFRMPGKGGGAGNSWEDPDDSAEYSVMKADDVRVTIATPALGEIVAKGQLLDREGKRLAGFRQKYQLWRGSRVLRIDVEIEPEEEPKADPWNSYYAARFAWGDEMADLWRTVNETRQPVGGKRFEAPHYVEVEGENEKARTAILTGGLPFHRRQGDNMLDSLLIVRGEKMRKFQLGIGIDLTHPMQEATGLLTPPLVVEKTSAPPSPSDSSWLFHIDSKNVIATHWEHLVEEANIVGYRVRLLETEGRTARVGLNSFRPATSARQIDFLGNTLCECKVDQGRVRLEMTGHEWSEVEVRH